MVKTANVDHQPHLDKGVSEVKVEKMQKTKYHTWKITTDEGGEFQMTRLGGGPCGRARYYVAFNDNVPQGKDEPTITNGNLQPYDAAELFLKEHGDVLFPEGSSQTELNTILVVTRQDVHA